MKYSVFFKEHVSDTWTELKGVTGDTIIVTIDKVSLPVRVIFLDTDERYEIPMTWLIKFSKERFDSIKNQMETESGQRIQTRENN